MCEATLPKSCWFDRKVLEYNQTCFGQKPCSALVRSNRPYNIPESMKTFHRDHLQLSPDNTFFYWPDNTGHCWQRVPEIASNCSLRHLPTCQANLRRKVQVQALARSDWLPRDWLPSPSALKNQPLEKYDRKRNSIDIGMFKFNIFFE